jgi:hypothetical protein
VAAGYYAEVHRQLAESKCPEALPRMRTLLQGEIATDYAEFVLSSVQCNAESEVFIHLRYFGVSSHLIDDAGIGFNVVSQPLQKLS